MSHITADATLLGYLPGIQKPVEVRDITGKVIGHYMPLASGAEDALYESAKRLFDAEEIERRLVDERGRGVPLAEIWKKLETQEPI